ncbi:MAG: DNA-3-methyladenine glycosylase [Balneolaceae bacterium]|nr:DNA-3-methyladenine glycosylase [Balneolaceae bacterium]
MIIDQSKIIPKSFYKNPDVVDVSRKLLGKVICSHINSTFTAGVITETEAYCGRNDKACHANNGLRTARTEVMYGEPGRAYIYLCYGIHHLLNVVTNKEGLADAVLIRAVKPLEGVEEMTERREIKNQKNLTDGPGKLTQALGVTTDLNTTNLSEPPLWIEDRGITFKDEEINTSSRIGVDYAGKDALKPWRFYVD